MAEQKTESIGIIAKSFQNIQFAKVSDKYGIQIQCNGNSEIIWIKFVNKTNTKTYEQTFSKQDIDEITSECKLSSIDLYQIILDQLSSTDFINKFCRLFLFADTEQANQKRDEFTKLKDIPNGIGDINDVEGNIQETNNEESKKEEKECALFLLHFSPSKYVRCNYCFIMREKHLSVNDRFFIKFNELKQENQDLKKELVATKNELHSTKTNLTQQINQISAKLQEMQNRFGNEQKVEEIDLNLSNNWQWYGTDNYAYSKPKAFKTGEIVYLQGLIKGGSNNSVIATLPQGWRPNSERIFCANQSGTAARINVLASGAIVVYSGYNQGWVPLDGIVYVIN